MGYKCIPMGLKNGLEKGNAMPKEVVETMDEMDRMDFANGGGENPAMGEGVGARDCGSPHFERAWPQKFCGLSRIPLFSRKVRIALGTQSLYEIICNHEP
jgi:hypothetical protein